MTIKIIPQAFLDQAGHIHRSWAVIIDGHEAKTFESEQQLSSYLKDIKEQEAKEDDRSTTIE